MTPPYYQDSDRVLGSPSGPAPLLFCGAEKCALVCSSACSSDGRRSCPWIFSNFLPEANGRLVLHTARLLQTSDPQPVTCALAHHHSHTLLSNFALYSGRGTGLKFSHRDITCWLSKMFMIVQGSSSPRRTSL
ncbi:hypothetical protein FHG87_001706 [Trinorchestia longiramus]|nr:hypothetical protein FHG87_001706 [Trinorchestia longiramus]